jgi:hypothetical protein
MPMKFLRNSILFLLFILAPSCQDQAGVLIGGVFKNLFNGNLFAGSATDSAYDQLEKKTELDETSTKPDCVTKVENIFSTETSNSISAIKDQLCTCKTWGSCDKDSCPCTKLCPNNFDILNRGPQSTGSRVEDQFSFNNSSIGQNYSNYQGFCWGFASLTQKFNRLANFKLLQAVPDDVKNNRFRKADFYKDIIAKIKRNEVVDIPGYRSLKEFSADPMIQDLLVPEIEDTWQTNAASWQGLQSVREGKKMSNSEYNQFFDDIEDQIANHQTPKVLFNHAGQSGWAHVVQVQSVYKDTNGKRFLCVWDNSYPLEKSANCGKKMELSPQGELTYNYAKVGTIQLPHDEKSETVAQVTNLNQHCRIKYQCSNE